MDSSSYSSEEVLNDLDPLSRALLDLSAQRGMDDAEIAQVLGTDEDSVFEVRVGLLRNLAEKVAPEQADAALPELEAAVTQRLYPEEAPEAEAAAVAETAVEADDLGDEVDEAELEEAPIETEAAATAEPDAEAAEAEAAEPDAEAPRDEPDWMREPDAAERTAAAAPPRERRRRSWLPIVLPILLLVAVIAVIVAAGVGSDDDGNLESSPPSPQQPSAPDVTQTAEEPQAAEPTPLTRLGSGGATGTATLKGGTLTLSLQHLPPANGGTYTVWLYNSIIDAKELGPVKNGKAKVEIPKDADKYEFLDVSLEPKDGNPNHSGQSVLRVERKKLEQSSG